MNELYCSQWLIKDTEIQGQKLKNVHLQFCKIHQTTQNNDLIYRVVCVGWQYSKEKNQTLSEQMDSITYRLKERLSQQTTGCGRKKWTPKFFRRFLSNRLGF